MSKEKNPCSLNNYNNPILFVDDDPIAHKIIKTQLVNWDISFAYSATEALEMLERRPFIIVISDINMPGMDGIALLKEIKQRHGIIQVIMVTASEQIDDLLNTLEAGATDFLLKPLNKDKIEEALKATLTKIKRWKMSLKELLQKR